MVISRAFLAFGGESIKVLLVFGGECINGGRF